VAKTAPAHKGLRPQSPARRSEEQGSAQRGAGSPESGRGAPVIFGDLTSQAIVGGDPLRLTRVASPNKIGAPAPPRQPPRLRDATVEPIVGASSNADPTRVSGVRSPRGPSSALRRARLRGWDRVGVHRTVVLARYCPAPGSHPSTHRLEPAPPSTGPLSLGLPIRRVLAAPRFALSTILSRNALAFHRVTGSRRGLLYPLSYRVKLVP